MTEQSAAPPQASPADPSAECPRCLKPLALCVCEGIARIDNKVSLLILQHPQEQDRELGTARLTALHFKDALLKIGLSWPSLTKILGRQTDPQRWAILYLGSVKAKAVLPDRDMVVVNKNGNAVDHQDSALIAGRASGSEICSASRSGRAPSRAGLGKLRRLGLEHHARGEIDIRMSRMPMTGRAGKRAHAREPVVGRRPQAKHRAQRRLHRTEGVEQIDVDIGHDVGRYGERQRQHPGQRVASGKLERGHRPSRADADDDRDRGDPRRAAARSAAAPPERRSGSDEARARRSCPTAMTASDASGAIADSAAPTAMPPAARARQRTVHANGPALFGWRASPQLLQQS